MPGLLEQYKQNRLGGTSGGGLLARYEFGRKSEPVQQKPLNLLQVGGGQTTVSGSGSLPPNVSANSLLTPYTAEEAAQRAAAMPDMFKEGETFKGALAQTPGKYINLGKSVLNDVRTSRAVDSEIAYYKDAALGSHQSFADAFKRADAIGNGERFSQIVQAIRDNPDYADTEEFRDHIRSELGLSGGQYPANFTPMIGSKDGATLLANIALSEASKVGAPPEAKGLWQNIKSVAGGVTGFASELAVLRKAGVPNKYAFGIPGAVEAASIGEDPQAAFVRGATVGAAMHGGSQFGGMLGESLGGGAITAAQGGSPSDIATMMLVPLAMRGPGIATDAISGRTTRQAIANHMQALEAGRRSLPGGGGQETVFDVAERVRGKSEPPSRRDLPGVASQQERIQIQRDIQEAARSQARLNNRVDELKKIKNKKTRERKLASDPVIMKELQSLRDKLTSGEPSKLPEVERGAYRAEANRISLEEQRSRNQFNEQGWREFEQDIMEELGVRAGTVDRLTYANKWSRRKPRTPIPPQADLASQAPGTPRFDLGEGVFTSRGEQPVTDSLRTRESRGVEPWKSRVTYSPEAIPGSDKFIKRQQEITTERAEFIPSEEPQYGADAMNLMAGSELLDAASKGLSIAKKVWRKYLTKFEGLPGYVSQLANQKEGFVSSVMKGVAQNTEDVSRAMRKQYGRKAMIPEPDRILINDVLQGRRPWSDIPQGELRDAVYRLRTELDAASQMMIDEGVIDGDLAALVDANKGVYLHRSYRVFDDPNWNKKVSRAAREDAYNYIKAEHPDWNDNQVRQQIGELLFQGKAAQFDSFLDFSRAMQLGQKDLSIFKPKQDIPKAIRRLWGEYEDPIENYRRSMYKMASMIGNHRLLSQMRENGMGSIFWTKNHPDIPADATAVVGEGDYRMTPIAGLRTYPEIERAVREYFKPVDHGWLLRWYMRVNGGVKMGKTVYSPATQVRNFTANPLILIANGSFNPVDFGKSAQAMWQDYWNSGDAAGRAKLRRMYELGVLGGDSATIGEIRRITQDISKKGMRAFEEAWSGKRQVRDLPMQTYRAMDDIFRLMEFENKYRLYRERIPRSEMSDTQLEQYVADMARDTVPTYSLAPRAVKALRLVPTHASFPTFFAEIMRTTYNRQRYMAREFQDPRLRGIAARRLAGQVIAYGAPSLLAGAAKYYYNITKQQNDDIREFLAPWDENSTLFITNASDDGTSYNFVNLSYTDPFEMYHEAANAFRRGDDPMSASLDALKGLLQPFTQEEILFQALKEAYTNKKDSSGAPVYNEQLPFGEQVRQATQHILDKIQPGVTADAMRELKAQMGYRDASGVQYPKWVTAAKMVTGIKVQSVDIPTAIGWRGRTFANQMREASNIFTNVVSDRGTVTESDMRSAYDQMERSRQELFADMLKKVQAAQRLGMTRKQIGDALVGKGVTKSMATDLLNGSYRPYQPGPTLLKGSPEHMQWRKKVVGNLVLHRQ